MGQTEIHDDLLPARIGTISKVPYKNDYWVKEGRQWTRIHHTPRNTLFSPLSNKDGPNIKYLEDERVTTIQLEGREPFETRDEWRLREEVSVGAPWTGKSVFRARVPDESLMSNRPLVAVSTACPATALLDDTAEVGRRTIT